MKDRVAMNLHIESVVGVGDDAERFAFDVMGKLNIVSGNHTLSFTEMREGCRIFTTLTYRPGGHRVHMKARGDVKYETVFDTSAVCQTVYEVAPCKLDLTVRSHEVVVNLDEYGGEMRLAYTRVIAGDVGEVVYTLTATAEEDV